ncbi:hypothetical protein [Parasphingorhabdus sp.]|uniref:hypothetical protein n=1 Tax=Parasphingorhabdus sp. TaxID=2709688 RepID=UPI00359325D1
MATTDKWNIEPLGELNSHPQEIVDNIADKGHLVPVHGSEDMAIFENRFEDHVCWQVLKAGHRTLSSNEEGANDTWYTGPGILQSTMEGDYAHRSGRIYCRRHDRGARRKRSQCIRKFLRVQSNICHFLLQY